MQREGKTYLHLTIHGITRANSTRIAWTATIAATVAPIAATLAVETIAGHVASIATRTTDDIGGEIALLRAVVLAVSDLTTCDIVRIHGKEEANVASTYSFGKPGSHRRGEYR